MKKGFTLIEILIVTIIAAILLGMTMNLGRDYIQSLSFKQDREVYISAIEEFIMRARTTNYYKTTKYKYIDITLENNNVQIFYGTGEVSDTISCGTGNRVRDIHFEKSILTGALNNSLILPYTMRIEPYKLGCKSCTDPEGNNTGIIKSKSTINDDETCFYFDGNLCKFNKISCP